MICFLGKISCDGNFSFGVVIRNLYHWKTIAMRNSFTYVDMKMNDLV